METINFETKITIRQAYLIMFDFLNTYWQKDKKPEELVLLLSQLQLWSTDNGKEPMDESVFKNWLNSSLKILKDEEANGEFTGANIHLS